MYVHKWRILTGGLYENPDSDYVKIQTYVKRACMRSETAGRKHLLIESGAFTTHALVWSHSL